MPDIHFSILGGAEEIGANCTYVHIGGNGVFIDAGLHPQKRDAYCFPDISLITQKSLPADALIISHAHTDHIGAVPYILHTLPHLRLCSTRPTRDIMQIMLQNTLRLLRLNPPDKEYWRDDILTGYSPEILEKIDLLIEAFPYKETFSLQSATASHAVHTTFHDAGHIIGSAGISLECNGYSIFHTADVQFDAQSLLPGASFPRHHYDLVFTEATNCASDPPERKHEIQRLARYINETTEANGSVLIPAFALGKSQEILTILWQLMRKGTIPHLPIYSGGMTKNINTVYDRYCYSVPRVERGFEVSDIPQIPLIREELLQGKYCTTPSLVVATSGMMNKGTNSFELAREWLRKSNFSIAIVGWQDPQSPGALLAASERHQEIMWGSTKIRRQCRVEKFSFTAHARREKIIAWLSEVRPKTLVIMHGDSASCERLAYEVSSLLPATRIILPRYGKLYQA